MNELIPAETRFGKLRIVRFTGLVTKYHNRIYECVCDCGNVKAISAMVLKNGGTRSCGCLRKIHGAIVGYKKTPEYRSWESMRSRCNNPNNKDFHRYGARGIKVCERWGTFSSFLSDMGERPDRTSLDRWPNKAGNYEPGNCRWATQREQCANRSKYPSHRKSPTRKENPKNQRSKT
jgi:hypothetical protein